MGGGRDFGKFPYPAGPYPNILLRNLTPDKRGFQVGGQTLAEFMKLVLRWIQLDRPQSKASKGGALRRSFSWAAADAMRSSSR